MEQTVSCQILLLLPKEKPSEAVKAGLYVTYECLNANPSTGFGLMCLVLQTGSKSPPGAQMEAKV